MGRPKGGKNRYWSKEGNLRIVKKIVDEGYSSKDVSKQENIDNVVIRRYVRDFFENEESALENQKKSKSIS